MDLTQHNSKANEAAFCADCCVQFKNVPSYKMHIKTSLKHVSLKDMKYKCTHCEKRCITAATLKSHMLVHTTEANFKYDFCSKAFKKAELLRDHISVVHEGKVKPKDKMCDICAKAFYNKASLRQHLNSHLGHRPYVCDVCSDTFSYHGALYKHKSHKHRKKPDIGKFKN